MPKSNIPKPFSGRKFQGILSQPIDRPNPVSVALFSAMQGKTVPHIVELNKLCDLYVEEQVNERLNSLAKSYGIGGLSYGIGKLLGSKSPGWEKELLLKLANDFVLGFTFTQENRKKDKGRKKKAPEHELAIHVFEKMKSKGTTAANACRLISKDKNGQWLGQTPKSLLERFNRLKASTRKEMARGPTQTPFENWLKRK